LLLKFTKSDKRIRTNWTEIKLSVKQNSERKKGKSHEIIPKEGKKKQEIINNDRLLKNLTEKKKKKTWHEQMTVD